MQFMGLSPHSLKYILANAIVNVDQFILLPMGGENIYHTPTVNPECASRKYLTPS